MDSAEEQRLREIEWVARTFVAAYAGANVVRLGNGDAATAFRDFARLLGLDAKGGTTHVNTQVADANDA